MTDYSQQMALAEIKRELVRQSALLEQLLALHQPAPATLQIWPTPQPKPSLVRRAVRWLRGA